MASISTFSSAIDRAYLVDESDGVSSATYPRYLSSELVDVQAEIDYYEGLFLFFGLFFYHSVAVRPARYPVPFPPLLRPVVSVVVCLQGRPCMLEPLREDGYLARCRLVYE